MIGFDVIVRRVVRHVLQNSIAVPAAILLLLGLVIVTGLDGATLVGSVHAVVEAVYIVPWIILGSVQRTHHDIYRGLGVLHCK